MKSEKNLNKELDKSAEQEIWSNYLDLEKNPDEKLLTKKQLEDNFQALDTKAFVNHVDAKNFSIDPKKVELLCAGIEQHLSTCISITEKQTKVKAHLQENAYGTEYPDQDVLTSPNTNMQKIVAQAYDEQLQAMRKIQHMSGKQRHNLQLLARNVVKLEHDLQEIAPILDDYVSTNMTEK